MALAILHAIPAAAQPVVPPCVPVLDRATPELSDLARFTLAPPVGGDDGCALAELVGAWSPFGLAVGRSGHLPHELRLIADLPPPDSSTYVVWAATPTLDRIVALGALQPGTPFTARVDWNKLMLIVSREEGPREVDAARWKGPIVLLGRSRSALLQNLMGHSIFRRAEMD